MLTAKEAFRVGFLCRCADEGLSPDEVRCRVEKVASLVEKQALSPFAPLAALSGAAGKLTNWGLGGAAVLPVAAGALGGYLAHSATEDSLDEDDVKKQELISELRHWARRAREQRRARQFLTA